MDEVESKLAAIFGTSGAENFFDAISPILDQNESLASEDLRAATTATAKFLRVIVKKLSEFDLGQEWVQETKLQSNESLLQAALRGAFLLGSLTASAPAEDEYRKSYLRQTTAKARAQDAPRCGCEHRSRGSRGVLGAISSVEGQRQCGCRQDHGQSEQARSWTK
jgi:hypothetical protein